MRENDEVATAVRPHRPRVLAAVVGAIALLGVTAVAVAARDGDPPAQVATDGPTTSSTTASVSIPSTSAPTTASVPPSSPSVPAPAPAPAGAGRSWIGVGLQGAGPTEGFAYGVRVRRGAEVLAERMLDGFDDANDGLRYTTFELPPGEVVLASDLDRGGAAPVDFADACETTVEIPDGGGVVVTIDWATGCLRETSAPGLADGPVVPTEVAPGTEGADPAPRDPHGTFDGMEAYALFTGRCPFLDHRLDATYTLADGAKWSYHATYCGEIDAQNRFTGTGEFTFTTADGSTLTGPVDSHAQLPSTGGAGTYRITGGTGAYLGAVGECTEDGHLEMIRFGRQHHWGDFSCEIELGPG